MPIVKYDRNAERSIERLLESQDISKKNKEYLKKFFDAKEGNVSDARLNIIASHIQHLVAQHPDIKALFEDREIANKIRKKLMKEQPRNWATIVNVSNTFTTWLNDGAKPKGFLDWVAPKKDSKYINKRDLKTDELWLWEEAKKVAENTNSIQIKAAWLTQVDAGFRPSEFIDLNYGDVVVDGDVIVFKVKAGKTGGRDVPCTRCVPAFLQWYEMHPTKKNNDPLWMTESMSLSHRKDGEDKSKRYKYPALNKRIRLMVQKSGIDKPCDFYSIRHSSCYLDKLDNLPLDLAADRHGHTVKFFVEVYAVLDTDAKISKMRSHYKMSDSDKDPHEPVKNLVCSRCDAVNDEDSGFCRKCASPLTLDVALKQKNDMANDVMQMLFERLSVREKDEIVALTKHGLPALNKALGESK